MRKFIIYIAFILLIINSLIFFNYSNNLDEINPPTMTRISDNLLLNSINYNYGKYVITIKNTVIYKKNNDKMEKVGTISKNTYLIIQETFNDDISNIYLKLDDTDYYVIKQDVKKTEKQDIVDYSTYKSKYTVVTKKVYTIKNNSGSLTLNDHLVFDILKKDTDYYFEFNNQIFSIDKNQISRLILNDVEVASSIPVLNYHFFYYEEYGNYCNQTICLSNTKLEEQLKYLKDNDFKTLTMQEFIDWYDGKIEVPEKSVLLTIDDGGMGTSISDGNILIPLLEKYETHATLFLITAWWSKDDYKSDYLEVESHGFDIHKQGDCGDKRITCLTKEELKEDLNKSIVLTGSNKAFCYPFYKYTDNSLEVIDEVGFDVAFAGGYKNATRNDNRYLISRIPIYDSISLDEFINMVN